MKKNISYIDISSGDIEICENMANQLYLYQTQKSTKHKDILSKMTFNNRLKKDFNNSLEKYLLVAFDEDAEKAVGYIYCSINEVTINQNNLPFDSPEKLDTNSQGMYPETLNYPAKIGILNNLYIDPNYQGQDIGTTLTTEGINWLNQTASDYTFVYVSEGNNAGKYYEKFGFKYSHSVLNDFLTAYYI